MAEHVLVTRGLTKRYGGHLAVNHADITIEKGQIYGLVGRNGAGKTTIIRMITAQTIPTAGELELFGAVEPAQLGRMRRRTGAMVETPSFYPYLSAAENLEYYRIQRGIPGRHVVGEALATVGLADTGKKKFKTFSWRQSSIAAAILSGDGRLSAVNPNPHMSNSGPPATSKAPPVIFLYFSDRALISVKKRSGTISSPALRRLSSEFLL